MKNIKILLGIVFLFIVCSKICFEIYENEKRLQINFSDNLIEKDFEIKICGEDSEIQPIFLKGSKKKIPQMKFGVNLIIIYKNKIYNTVSFFISPDEDEKKCNLSFDFSLRNDSLNCKFKTLKLNKNFEEEVLINKNILTLNKSIECN